MVRATLLAVALVLATGAAVQASPTPTRIPFSGTGIIVGVLDEGVVKVVGDTVYIRGLVLSNVTDVDNPMLDGPLTVTLDMVRGPEVNAWWGTEVWAPTAYPGEGFRCTAGGGWDADGVLFASDVCHGFGRHLGAWQMRSFVSGESVTGYLLRPGS